MWKLSRTWNWLLISLYAQSEMLPVLLSFNLTTFISTLPLTPFTQQQKVFFVLLISVANISCTVLGTLSLLEQFHISCSVALIAQSLHLYQHYCHSNCFRHDLNTKFTVYKWLEHSSLVCLLHVHLLCMLFLLKSLRLGVFLL